jgi:D-glycero-D-manno-heptose 1,7-bisphosphate phosphatase
MLLAAAADFHLDLTRCIFVGDSVTDYAAARAAGCQSVLVRTGRQAHQLAQLAEDDPSVVLMNDLSAVVSWIEAHRADDIDGRDPDRPFTLGRHAL